MRALSKGTCVHAATYMKMSSLQSCNLRKNKNSLPVGKTGQLWESQVIMSCQKQSTNFFMTSSQIRCRPARCCHCYRVRIDGTWAYCVHGRGGLQGEHCSWYSSVFMCIRSHCFLGVNVFESVCRYVQCYFQQINKLDRCDSTPFRLAFLRTLNKHR